MAVEPPPNGDSTLPPDEAFDIVGDETRIQILRALGAADEPLSYSELLDRIDYDATNFHYHLKQLVGHFVRKTDDGYTLQQAGGRVVKAILSGAVTDMPVIERTPADTSCYLCGDEMELTYRQEVVGLFCASCGGITATDEHLQSDHRLTDIVGTLGLPPAGVQDRTPAAIVRAAEIWTVTHGQAVARNVCPWCSAALEDTVSVCPDHDPSGDRCDECDHRFGVLIHVNCSNCLFDQTSVGTARLLSLPAVMRFLLDHDIDPINPEAFHLTADETLRTTDPLHATYTLAAGDETLTVTVTDGFDVVDVTRATPANPE